MTLTTIPIEPEYLGKMKILAKDGKRSQTRELEIIIDQALKDRGL